MKRIVYLDNNASAPPLPEVADAVHAAMKSGLGNPSSAHSRGDAAQELVESARESVASLIGADPSRVVFTSGGTEANNQAILSCLDGRTRARVVTTRVEHSSVIKLCEQLETVGCEIDWLEVDCHGVIDLEDLETKIATNADLVSVQWVNNETGVIQPVQAISKICHSAGVPYHCDAAQAVGKLPISTVPPGIDYLSFTAHKIHGPQGIGALYAAPGRRIRPMLFGGDQERSHRPGTENVPGIVGFGEAARQRLDRLKELVQGVAELRDYFERELLSRIDDLTINGCRAERVCNSSSVLFSGIDGQALIARLDQRGVICSQSSACTNRRPEPSYVLMAMGLNEGAAFSSVRFSLSGQTTRDEILYAVSEIQETVSALRAFAGSSVFAA